VSEARQLLDRGLAELDLAASELQVSQLLELGELVAAWGQRINLTGHRGLHAILHRLVLDAVALLAPIPAIESLADLGSGAGFPGLPAAILRPECRVTLVESREKRHHFQRAACRSLGLANATPVRGRAEELVPTLHSAVVAQAMAKPPEALARAQRWTQVGGLILIPGATDAPDLPELDHVQVERVVRYRVPCGGPPRSLWIGRKIA
jgi:16S rRNA (guanine527-N7)-methyltransferase